MWLLRKDDACRYQCPCCRGEFVSPSLLSELADNADNDVGVDDAAGGRGVNDDGTATGGGVVGGNNVDGAAAATTATAAAPRADPRPPPLARMVDDMHIRPGVALQLLLSVQQERWQLAQQRPQQQQRPG
jgi:hypothetical protein